MNSASYGYPDRCLKQTRLQLTALGLVKKSLNNYLERSRYFHTCDSVTPAKGSTGPPVEPWQEIKPLKSGQDL